MPISRIFFKNVREPSGSVYLPVTNNGGTIVGTWSIVSGPSGASINGENLEYTLKVDAIRFDLQQMIPTCATYRLIVMKLLYFISTRPDFEFYSVKSRRVLVQRHRKWLIPNHNHHRNRSNHFLDCKW